MSYRAVRHSNPKEIIRRASSGAENYSYSDFFFRDGIDFLDLTRAADELQTCSAEQSEGNTQAR
eukprot:2968976-Pyramimonas_sp.AAC.1